MIRVPISVLAVFVVVLVASLAFWAMGEGFAIDSTQPASVAAPAPISGPVVVVTERR